MWKRKWNWKKLKNLSRFYILIASCIFNSQFLKITIISSASLCHVCMHFVILRRFWWQPKQTISLYHSSPRFLWQLYQTVSEQISMLYFSFMWDVNVFMHFLFQWVRMQRDCLAFIEYYQSLWQSLNQSLALSYWHLPNLLIYWSETHNRYS